eukprot:gene4760-5939_t
MAPKSSTATAAAKKTKETTAAAKPAAVPKTDTAGAAKPKKKKKSDYNSFSSYIHKLLKAIAPSNAGAGGEKNKKYTISSVAMKVMNSFVHDIFERIATEASVLARKKKRSTLHARDIQVAVRITLTGELAKHAIVQGMTAVNKYNPQRPEATAK